MIAFRTALPRDRRFIVSAWSASLRKSDYAGMIANDDWETVMHPQIERVLDSPGMQTVVAYSHDAEPGVADLHGFIAADVTGNVPLVAYVYVKSSYRRGRGRLWSGDGLGRQLFKAIGVDPKLPFVFICRTAIVDELARHIPHATFKPVLGRKDRAA